MTEVEADEKLALDDALEMVEPIMHGNARRIFRLDEKEKLLRTVPWKRT
jgi:predicted TIM-barrel fold metal-dependent hydrolase